MSDKTEALLFDLTPESTLTISRLILDRLKVGARTRVSGHLAASMRVEEWAEPMMRDLVYQLQAEVLAENAGREAHTVPVSHTVVYEEVQRGLWAWLTAASVVAIAVMGLFGFAAAIGCAILLAALALVTDYSGSLHTRRRTTWRGEATFGRDLWRAFPEATIAYPPDLGRPVERAIYDSTPSVAWSDPDTKGSTE